MENYLRSRAVVWTIPFVAKTYQEKSIKQATETSHTPGNQIDGPQFKQELASCLSPGKSFNFARFQFPHGHVN